jgi:hypothetical protein
MVWYIRWAMGVISRLWVSITVRVVVKRATPTGSPTRIRVKSKGKIHKISDMIRTPAKIFP